MKSYKLNFCVLLAVFFLTISPGPVKAWNDETHIAIAKAAGYPKWFNAAGADMAKIKAHEKEAHNHYVNNPPGAVVNWKMVLAQAKKYDKTDKDGHLYGAIIASLRDYFESKNRGKYGEYHPAFCAHYIGDLSQPLHNILYNAFNRRYHNKIDGIINDEVLDNLKKIKIYPITIDSEKALAKEVVRIANLSMKLGYEIEIEGRFLTKEEAYRQVGHSASLFKAILGYLKKMN